MLLRRLNPDKPSLCVRVAKLIAGTGALTGLLALLRPVIALPAGGKGDASDPGSIDARPYDISALMTMSTDSFTLRFDMARKAD